MENRYSEQELNEAYMLLSGEQKAVLDNYIKRGMKTEWLNAWAKKKGAVLDSKNLEDPESAMESLLEWVLLDYEDSLSINPNIRCECGRALRYRYTVLHKETGKIYKLGRVHFEQHTELDPETVRLIMKGFKVIDTEREEILFKIISKWTMPFSIPLGLQIPKDMQDQLKVSLPLLDRQVKRLYLMVKQYNNNKYTNKIYSKTIQPNIIKSPLANETAAAADISKIDIQYVMTKLKSIQITSEEARQLYYFIKLKPEELERHGIRIQDIKSMSTRALGRIANSNIRKWLVEIEYL